MKICPVDYRLHAPITLHASFDIHGFTALLGRSGAGKTSLLKALAGLIPAAGTPGNGAPPEARNIGYLPQNTALFPHLTVLENVAYPLRGRDRFTRAAALLDTLGLASLATRPAPTLSGGEAQRVALARALARDPQLLLLDEPSAALDATTRQATLDWLVATITARAVPSLAATHDPAIAQMADWLVLLAEGRVIQQGTPRAVFAAPISVAAAQLLGFENIWPEADHHAAIRATDIAIAGSHTPGPVSTGTVLTTREHGLGLRLECAMPHRITVYLPAGTIAD
ncbi:MAG: ABC transporter ATP-binding protein, partial [Acidocella sp.]|nr:ABC transporter ATP-binding protein [Acidocella sp.]